MKEPIKMHVEFSLLHKILLIIEMRSKIFKAKGGTAEWLQYKVTDNGKLWLISFFTITLEFL